MQVTRRSLIKGAALGTAGLCGVAAMGDARLSVARAATPADSGADAHATKAGGDGTYTAVAPGIGGDVTVTITIKDGRLADVQADGPNETDGIGTRALQSMPPQMVATNSVQVDAVSGASVTSKAILDAAADALAQSGVTLTPETAAPVEQHMTPGTYEGEAFGKWKEGTIEGERFGSPAIIAPTKVAVTVDETKIVSVEVESCDDTPGFIEPCIERVPAAIVESQSLNVDTVTGATMTSQAIISAASQALEQAGADLTGFNAAPQRTDATEEYDCDFAVVSAGGAGTVAALRALEAGLKVVVIEKCGKVGGESACSTGVMAIGSNYLASLHEGEELPAINDVFTEMIDYAKYRADASIVQAFLNNCGPVADFLETHWDQVDDYDGFKAAPLNTGLDTGKGTTKYQTLYDNFIIPLGGTLLLETRAEELLTDEAGAVVGVKAKKQDGTQVTVRAKATLVACGGFGGNPELQREYLHTDNFYLYGLATNTGDGLAMAKDAGAVITREVNPHLAEFCSNRKVDFYAGYMKFINYTGLLQVNPEGRRFYNEELGASDPLAVGTSALYAMDHAYAIFCQADMDKMVENGGAAMMSEEVRAEMKNYRSRACVPFYTLPDEMQAAIKAGEGWQADSLEDLGAQIGFDPDVWAQTVSTYLAAIESGDDAEFHKRPEMLYPLSEGPFYAVRICPAMDGTLNGVRVNQYMQALGQDLSPIPGLFMGGYDAGGFWGNVYYQTPHTNALTQGYAITSGYIAANKVIEQLGASSPEPTGWMITQ
ncbi:FAD-binding protein [bacterium]|nr:FAD-binding protein [bacterium]